MPFECEYIVYLREGGIMFTYLREALTARFILKGIPEPQNVRRVEIQTLTLFLFFFNASEESPAALLLEYGTR